VLIWFAISVPLILWDVTFVLARPSFFLWAPYKQYVTVDLGYAHPDGFVRAQAIMSLFEIAVLLVGLAWRRRPVGVLLVCVVSALTAAKTLLIFLIEVVTHGQGVGHNPTSKLVLMYVLPNAAWVVMPLFVAYVTGRSLVRSVGGVDAEARRAPGARRDAGRL
jgi:hypothetical protein